MSNSAETRTEVVSRAMEGLRALFAAQELNRDSLKGVETLLAELIESRELFSSADFPDPSGDEEAKIYLLAEDEGSSNSLYLVCAASGTKAPAHDHQTWAAIGGLEGEEVNYIFERVDDGCRVLGELAPRVGHPEPEPVELDPAEAASEPEDRSAAGDLVEHRPLLAQPDRVVPRQDVDHRAELDLAAPGRSAGLE